MSEPVRKIYIAFVIAGLVLVPSGCRNRGTKSLEGRITLSGAWALYPMAVKWGEEFEKSHPKVKVDIQAGGAGKGVADVLSGMVDLGMVSRDVRPEEVAKGALPFAVTKDGVVATASAENPFLKDILAKGVSRPAFIDIWMSGQATTWGRALGTSVSEPVHVFTRSDACGAAETWAAYLGGRQEDLGGVGVYGDPGLADAVRRDPLGIGFNNINFAYDAKTLNPVEGLAVIPLDLDGNGTLDAEESFYVTRDELTGAIARGAYPSPPARDLFLVAKGRPGRSVVVEFLRWILTDGQAFVPETGYIRLGPEKLAESLKSLER